jgi:hypothetical protein
MPASHQADKSSEILPDAANKYAEAVDDAQHEAQKKYRAAWHNYLESLKVALDQPKIQEAALAYAEGVQKSLAHQDSQRYLEAVRKYATAAQEAQEGLQTRWKEAYVKWVAEVQEASAHVAKTQRAQFENYVRALQDAFSRADASQADAVTLAKMGIATLSAAALRAYLV